MMNIENKNSINVKSASFLISLLSFIFLSAETIADTNNDPVGLPTISGVAKEGQILAADVSAISDADTFAKGKKGEFAYQWLRNRVDINKATASIYTLVQEDVGSNISVKVSYVDGGRTTETLISAETATVANLNNVPEGSLTISGKATEGKVLTAVTSDIGDADGLGPFNFQWLRDGVDIIDAVHATYTLVQADVATLISVRISYTDGGATEEAITSLQTTAVVNVNDPPVGLPVIIGNTIQNEILTADISGISDEDGMNASVFSYQWKSGKSNVGSDSSTYFLQRSDVGNTLTVTVSYYDGGLTAESITSVPTSIVADVNNLPVGVPFIIGDPTQGVTISVDTAGITDLDGLGPFNFQWLRDGVDIIDAVHATYTLVQADVAALISVRISYTDGGATEEAITSLQTTAVVNVNDPPVGLPVIIGNTIQNEILTADISGISDEDGMNASVFSYQWLRDGVDILEATTEEYTLLQTDVAALISVRVNYTDGGNEPESVTSLGTVAVENVNDLPVGKPVITGSLIPGKFVQGEVLTADTTNITDIDGLGLFAYQWLRDGIEIFEATASTYNLVQADVETLLSVIVSYIDSGLTEEILLSDEVGPIINFNDIGAVTIIGEATVAADIPLTVGELRDADGITGSNFIYQWLRAVPDSAGVCNNASVGIAIVGATADTYGLTNNDLKMCLTLRVTYTDDFGADEVIFSNLKGPIFPDVPKVTPPATIGPIAATGWFTYVNLEQLAEATAKDGLDGVLKPVSDSNGQFRPGENVVTWSATDSADNIGTATQIVKVIPIAEVSKMGIAAEGSEAHFVISLNGDALQYPVVVPYTVNGTAANDGSDHGLCLTSGTVNCAINRSTLQAEISENDNTETTIAFHVFKDDVSEGVENIVITLGTPQNAVLGQNSVHTIEIYEDNVPPVVNLEATQVQLDIDSSTVTVFAMTTDANGKEALSYDWSRSDNAIPGTYGATGDLFSFEPADLTPGIYTLRVDVSDGQATSADTLILRVVEKLPELSASNDADGDGEPDAADGFDDSDGDGVSEYLDAIQDGNVIQILSGVSNEFLIQTEPGLKLSLGEMAFKANHGASLIEEGDVINPKFGDNIDVDTIGNVGGYFDFAISGLPIAGLVVNVVIPQISAMPRIPVYRKLVQSEWQNFVLDSKNKVTSAAGEEGYCPPPGSAAYQPGLSKGHWCLQLSIEDGGPNDSDGVANNTVTDPGGVGQILSDVSVSSRGSSGGAWHPLLLALSILIMLYFRNMHISTFY